MLELSTVMSIQTNHKEIVANCSNNNTYAVKQNYSYSVDTALWINNADMLK